MQIKARTVEEYIKKVPIERQKYFIKLRKVILENLPPGFLEKINYGMIGYVVPHSLYPQGYHSNPQLPLPFINIASQKHFIAFYHLGIYANSQWMDWFIEQYSQYCKTKIDMGKSCIRFKKIENIPYKLIGQIVKKISVQEWIDTYEQFLKK